MITEETRKAYINELVIELANVEENLAGKERKDLEWAWLMICRRQIVRAIAGWDIQDTTETWDLWCVYCLDGVPAQDNDCGMCASCFQRNEALTAAGPAGLARYARAHGVEGTLDDVPIGSWVEEYIDVAMALRQAVQPSRISGWVKSALGRLGART